MVQKTVRIADMDVLKNEGVLVTIGLGSCVGIALYDQAAKVGGLAHILLADSKQFKNRDGGINEAKFADTTIPLLLKKMEKIGAKKNRVKAKIAGGSRLFSFQNNELSVGDRNVMTTRKVLKELGIPLVAEDVGGNYGRSMRFYVDSGQVVISTVGKGTKKL